MLSFWQEAFVASPVGESEQVISVTYICAAPVKPVTYHWHVMDWNIE